jgi:NAD+ kinase
MVHSVAIYSKDNRPKTRDGVIRVVNEFCRRGIKIYIYQRVEDTIICPGSELIEEFSDFEGLSEKPDLILSIGGDGTFLETVMKVKDLGIPVAGVNTGRMGFLANIPNEDIGPSIEMLCKGEFKIIERSLLDIVQPKDIFGGGSASALNEITIQKSNPIMITINVHVDGDYLNNYWADGLIISTATGSTAYNLSSGGPILSPEDESIIISHISPHNLTIRPIIISGESRLRMLIEGRCDAFLATCDSQSKLLPFREDIHIMKSPGKIKTVMLNGRDFYSTLRTKLMWGADTRN